MKKMNGGLRREIHRGLISAAVLAPLVIVSAAWLTCTRSLAVVSSAVGFKVASIVGRISPQAIAAWSHLLGSSVVVFLAALSLVLLAVCALSDPGYVPGEHHWLAYFGRGPKKPNEKLRLIAENEDSSNLDYWMELPSSDRADNHSGDTIEYPTLSLTTLPPDSSEAHFDETDPEPEPEPDSIGSAATLPTSRGPLSLAANESGKLKDALDMKEGATQGVAPGVAAGGRGDEERVGEEGDEKRRGKLVRGGRLSPSAGDGRRRGRGRRLEERRESSTSDSGDRDEDESSTEWMEAYAGRKCDLEIPLKHINEYACNTLLEKEIIGKNGRGELVRFKWCPACLHLKHPRTRHCSVCDRCCDKFDHHCIWICNCVGLRNQRYFLFFIYVILVYTSLVAFLDALALHITFSNIIGSFLERALLLLKSQFLLVSALFLSLGVIIPVLNLVLYHTLLMLENVTPAEEVANMRMNASPRIHLKAWSSNLRRFLFQKRPARCHPIYTQGLSKSTAFDEDDVDSRRSSLYKPILFDAPPPSKSRGLFDPV